MAKQSKNIFFNTQVLPLILVGCMLTILFVLFRMKIVELDYQTIGIRNSIEKATDENKELRAQKAKLLSVNQLRQMAKNHNLGQPKQDQIIIIP
jgi:cell division protein FtsL